MAKLHSEMAKLHSEMAKLHSASPREITEQFPHAIIPITLKSM